MATETARRCDHPESGSGRSVLPAEAAAAKYPQHQSVPHYAKHPQGKTRTLAGTDEQGPQPLGGRLLAEITNRIIALMRERYGRGPITSSPM